MQAISLQCSGVRYIQKDIAPAWHQQAYCPFLGEWRTLGPGVAMSAVFAWAQAGTGAGAGIPFPI